MATMLRYRLRRRRAARLLRSAGSSRLSPALPRIHRAASHRARLLRESGSVRLSFGLWDNGCREFRDAAQAEGR